MELNVWPSIKDYGKLIKIKANIVSIGTPIIKEIKKKYECKKCKKSAVITAGYEKKYNFNLINNCINCNNRIFPVEMEESNSDYFIDYREIIIQELVYKKKPSTLIVTLENELAHNISYTLGSMVIVHGTVKRQWAKIINIGDLLVVKTTIKASSIITLEQNISALNTTDLQIIRNNFHEIIKNSGEYVARNLLVQSFCPTIFGLDFVKLAVALSLCSSYDDLEKYDDDNVKIRSDSHLLLVGDPGMAKSKLLKSAANIACKSCYTDGGSGCTSAGLTAAAIKEDGEWYVEAGALVLADRGICCIDEFNLMREQDKNSLHEAMEQQRISFAKASLVCQLRTRCVIIAATNPKVVYSNSKNIGVKTPLLSRFDLVLELNDDPDEKWDAKVVDHIAKQIFPEKNHNELWDLNTLQCHFMAARKITTEMTAGAQTVISTYYKLCRNDPMREQSRTSVRLYESLIRLANSHARLLFRNKVTISDAIMVVRLNESSYSFGRIIKPTNIIKDSIPFSDDDSDNKILEILQLKRSNLITQIPQIHDSEKEKEKEEEINTNKPCCSKTLDIVKPASDIKKKFVLKTKKIRTTEKKGEYFTEENCVPNKKKKSYLEEEKENETMENLDDLDLLLSLDFLNTENKGEYFVPKEKEKEEEINTNKPCCSKTLDIVKPASDIKKKFVLKTKKIRTTEKKGEYFTEENCVPNKKKKAILKRRKKMKLWKI